MKRTKRTHSLEGLPWPTKPGKHLRLGAGLRAVTRLERITQHPVFPPIIIGAALAALLLVAIYNI